ncbi:hypothetical protein [Rhodococcus wratislaviensis]
MIRTRDALPWIAPVAIAGLGTLVAVYARRSDEWHMNERFWAGLLSFA